MINFYNYLTDKKVSQSLYEMLFSKFMQNEEPPTYREYTGTLPVTITANGSDLADWVIYGNTGGVGEKTYNLYNNANTSWTLGVLNDNGEPTSSTTSHYTTNFTSVNANTAYSLYGTIYKEQGQLISNRIYYYDSSLNWISRSSATSSKLKTFTTPANCAYIRIQVRIDIESGDDWNLVEGTYTEQTMPLYEPYGYKITILSGSDVTDIYIDAPLGANETVSFADTNVHIPTNNGSTVISCDNTVQPEKMYIKYIGG